MSTPLPPRFLNTAYWISLVLLGVQTVWLLSMVALYQLTRFGVIETRFLQTNDAQPSIAGDPLIQIFGYLYVILVIASFLAVLRKHKWAFWTYLGVLICHAVIWIGLTDNPFVFSYVTLVLIVVESGVLLLIQLLGNAGKLR
ncbi:hypothetical protein [Maricaulis parjimensis]|uniref:hypothetical protein n=1 Tax=Maricaulis parjimensis TaxID=144023 RepID=UPI00193A3D15|nr:hypothetical protein [Maricaulis parjimensis]